MIPCGESFEQIGATGSYKRRVPPQSNMLFMAIYIWRLSCLRGKPEVGRSPSPVEAEGSGVCGAGSKDHSIRSVGARTPISVASGVLKLTATRQCEQCIMLGSSRRKMSVLCWRHNDVKECLDNPMPHLGRHYPNQQNRTELLSIPISKQYHKT